MDATQICRRPHLGRYMLPPHSHAGHQDVGLGAQTTVFRQGRAPHPVEQRSVHLGRHRPLVALHCQHRRGAHQDCRHDVRPRRHAHRVVLHAEPPGPVRRIPASSSVRGVQTSLLRPPWWRPCRGRKKVATGAESALDIMAATPITRAVLQDHHTSAALPTQLHDVRECGHSLFLRFFAPST